MPTNVLIAGGGPAALEAALALHRLAGDRFLRRDADESDVAGHALWWPPAKIAGLELAGYLEGLDEEAGRRTGLRVNLDVGDADADSAGVEVLSLH